MIVLYLLALSLLGIYSYSQIDLNLTLFSHPAFLWFQNQMIQLGYYQRPFSAGIYLALILVLFICYFKFLKTPPKNITALLAFIVFIGFISYPAFSHDIFNYMFDTKILTFYHQNPYVFKALDFPFDPWLRFMHWVHRTYPYGPVWLLVTAPFSYLGFGKFILTLLNFKLLFIATYLGNVWLLKKISPKSFLFFALNPLVIIESLISPHIDSFMALTMLLAIYFWQKDFRFKALFTLILSGGTKFLTFLLLPILGKRKLSVIVLLVAIAAVISQRAPYPWYFLPVLALTSLVSWNKFGLFLSLGAMLTYLPYLFVGSYPQDVLNWEYILFFLPLVIFVLSQVRRVWQQLGKLGFFRS